MEVFLHRQAVSTDNFRLHHLVHHLKVSLDPLLKMVANSGLLPKMEVNSDRGLRMEVNLVNLDLHPKMDNLEGPNKMVNLEVRKAETLAALHKVALEALKAAAVADPIQILPQCQTV